MMVTPVEIFGGVALDFAAGDPRWLPHPVAGMGRLAIAAEKFWRTVMISARVAGSLAWLSVVAMVCALVYVSIALLPAPWIQIYWIFSFLAVRSLDTHAGAVIAHLQAGDLGAARAAVAMIVGRDTADLDEPEITRAVFETVAESLNDGVVAPLFWLAIGGPVAMAGYKAANTLDSMFGHRNERYREFGWASARMDDLANLIPARLTAARTPRLHAAGGRTRDARSAACQTPNSRPFATINDADTRQDPARPRQIGSQHLHRQLRRLKTTAPGNHRR